MKIIKIKELEDCFDGTFMKEALLSENVTKTFIDHLAETGKLEYHASFTRPYFRIDVPGMFIIKGVEGNRSIRLILNRKKIESALDFFQSYVNDYTNGNK